MECSRIRKSLKKYLQHSAEASITQEVEEHLSVCSSCREYLDGIMAEEGKGAMRKKLVPVLAALGVIILMFTVFQLRQASCGIKKEVPHKPLSAQQEALEKAFKGDWVAVFYDTFAGKNVPQELSITASFPQQEGEVTVLDKTYHYFKVPTVLTAEVLIKTVNAIREKTADPARLVISWRLDNYLSSTAPATETSIVYFYVLTPPTN